MNISPSDVEMKTTRWLAHFCFAFLRWTTESDKSIEVIANALTVSNKSAASTAFI